MPRLKISIPPDIDFSMLKLVRDTSTGGVTFSWDTIERICEYNQLDIAMFRDQHEDNIAELLVAWYTQHIASGGEPDPVAEDLLAEVKEEDEHGGGASHPPGRA